MVRQSRRTRGQVPDTNAQSTPDRLIKDANRARKLARQQAAAANDDVDPAVAESDAEIDLAETDAPAQLPATESTPPQHQTCAGESQPTTTEDGAGNAAPAPEPGSQLDSRTTPDPGIEIDPGDNEIGGHSTKPQTPSGDDPIEPVASFEETALEPTSAAGTKRRSEGSQEDGSNSPKRQKTGEADEATETDSDAKGKKYTTEAEAWTKQEPKTVKDPSDDPCGLLASNLAALRGDDGFIGPVISGELTSQEVLFQALSSVLEAINRNQTNPVYTLFHPQATTDHPHLAFLGIEHPITNRAHEALIPYHRTSPDGRRAHYSLLSIRRAGDQFKLDHYDSSATMRASYNFDAAKRHVMESLWAKPDVNPHSDLLGQGANIVKVRDQTGGWCCGLHVILNGWAVAMGFKLNKPALSKKRSDDCYARAVEVVNLAIHGRMDADTILAFFLCYEWVSVDSVVSDERDFDLTVAFPTEASLSAYVTEYAQLADALAATQPAVASSGPSGASQGAPGSNTVGPSMSAEKRRLLDAIREREQRVEARTNEQAENEQYDDTVQEGNTTLGGDDDMEAQLREGFEGAGDTTQGDITVEGTAIDYPDDDQTVAPASPSAFGGGNQLYLPGLGLGRGSQPPTTSGTQAGSPSVNSPVSAANPVENLLATIDNTADESGDDNDDLFDPNGRFTSSPAPPTTPALPPQQQPSTLTNIGQASLINSLFNASATFASSAAPLHTPAAQTQQQQPSLGDSGRALSTDSFFNDDFDAHDVLQGTPTPYQTHAPTVEADGQDDTMEGEIHGDQTTVESVSDTGSGLASSSAREGTQDVHSASPSANDET